MKAFVKRIIWFFGMWTFNILDDLLYFFTHGTPIKYEGIGPWIFTLIWIVPLFFMEDD